MNQDIVTRTPAEVGYLPWVLQRASAIALVGLLVIHLGVQLYPTYGFLVVLRSGWYGTLLDGTLALVLLHGVLGVRSTVLQTSLSSRLKSLVIWGVASLAILLLGYRLLA